MLIKEYRIPLPLTLDEYRIAQLYMIQKKSREESEGEDSGVEIIENRPYEEGPFGSGQYTYKVYHIGRHIPSWFRSIVPKTALEVHEESWNAYPCTKTKFSVPFVEKFFLEVDTIFQPDSGDQENIFNLKPSELRQRELDVIDIVNDSLTGSDYLEEEDPSLYHSSKTNRGPLGPDWIQDPPGGIIMCSYKLIKVEFRYWGLQSRIERFIHDYGLRRVMLRAHRQAWAWQDEWVGLTMEDIRELELETQQILQRKLGRIVSDLEGGALEEDQDSTERKEEVSKDVTKWEEPSSAQRGTEPMGDSNNKAQRRRTPSKRGRSGNSKRPMLSTTAHSFSQATSPSDLHNNTPRPGNVSDGEESVYSYYALDSIAISDDSDTEYFDAQEVIDYDEESDDEFVDPEGKILELPSMEATPYVDMISNEIPGDFSPDFLFLVVHGGCGLQRGTLDSANHDIDFRTLKETLHEVLNTHYQFGRGRVTIKLIPSPNIGGKAYDILSSLNPSNSHTSVNFPPSSQNSASSYSFPICALPILASVDPAYSLSLRQLVLTSNIIYRDFLESSEGQSFNGHVCILADCLGSVMVYDILCRPEDHSPCTTPTNNKRLSESSSHSSSSVKLKRLPSPLESSCKPKSLGAHPVGSPEQNAPPFSTKSSELAYSGFMFEVSSIFMFGSPLGYVLSHRQMLGHKVAQPRCSSIYNLFYSVDPLAARLEPVLDPLFSSIAPVLIPSYGKYPTGDKSSFSLRGTVSKHSDLFQSSNQSFLPPTHEPKKTSSTEFLASVCEEEEELMSKSKNNLRPFCFWWSDYRIDYMLEVPSGLERFEYLPNTAYAHIVQARYWEAKEMASFILRQMLQGQTAPVSPSLGSSLVPMWVPFVPPTSTVKWAKKKTPLRIQHMSPNHRAVDAVVSSSSTHAVITLQAKFFYGPLNMAPLSGEMVDIYLLGPQDKSDSGRSSSLETCSTQRLWQNVATISTDKHGRANYDMAVTEHLPGVGMYPVNFLVKGDHTTASCNIFVLAPHTEAVVFSIDGALTSNFSLSGRDMKLRSGVLDVARLWQELGYLIIYITGRPDMQKEYITSWLGLHGFPMGVVSFSDSLSTDSNNIKLLYLARLIKEAKIILSAAYGSQRHLAVFKELGLQSNQIFIHSKSGSKKMSGGSKKQEMECQIIDKFDAHYLDLKASQPRQAAVSVRDIVGEFTFSFPGSRSKTQPAGMPIRTRKPRSSSSPKQYRKNSD